MMDFARNQHLAKLRWEVHRTGGDVRVADAEHQHHAALRGDEHRHSLRRLPPAPEADTPRGAAPSDHFLTAVSSAPGELRHRSSPLKPDLVAKLKQCDGQGR